MVFLTTWMAMISILSSIWCNSNPSDKCYVAPRIGYHIRGATITTKFSTRTFQFWCSHSKPWIVWILAVSFNDTPWSVIFFVTSMWEWSVFSFYTTLIVLMRSIHFQVHGNSSRLQRSSVRKEVLTLHVKFIRRDAHSKKTIGSRGTRSWMIRFFVCDVWRSLDRIVYWKYRRMRCSLEECSRMSSQELRNVTFKLRLPYRYSNYTYRYRLNIPQLAVGAQDLVLSSLCHADILYDLRRGHYRQIALY